VRAYHRERSRKYREEQPHIAFYTTSRYLARKAGTHSDLTKEDAFDIYSAAEVCAYCGKERAESDGPRSFHIDHVIPMSRGGHNSRWNLVKACISCNTSKGSDSLLTFRARTPTFTESRYNDVVEGMALHSGKSSDDIVTYLERTFEAETRYAEEMARLSEQFLAA